MKVKCKIIKQVFAKDDFRVFGVIPMQENTSLKLNKYGNFTISGSLSYLENGQEYVFDLEEGETNKYGTQYIVKACPTLEIEELTDDNELMYLERITTPSQAKYVHSAYPDFIRRILKGEEDTIDVDKIFNVGAFRLGVYIREVNEKFKYFQILAMFPDYKLNIEDAKVLTREFSSLERVKEMLQEQPYRCLIEILSRSFERVDKLLMSIRSDLQESKQRTEFFLLWLLDRNELDGSTRIYANDLASHIKEYAPELLKQVKDTAIESTRIYYDEKTKDMARMDTYLAECNIAQFCKEKVTKSKELWVEHGYENFVKIGDFELSEKQKGLLINTLKYEINILLGYSGSGKSSSVIGLIKMLEENKLTYTLVAPTGKASKRLSECTNRKAGTIHRQLGTGISTDVLIIDEFSMVDVRLCNALFQSITNDDCRVVIIGDNAQLSAIGAGNVFNDMIESNTIPITFLDEVFRYKEGGMLKVATDIRMGKSYFESNEPVQKYGKNFTFIQADNDTAFDILIAEYTKALTKFKPQEIMVLSPFNVGECGTYNINNVLQQHVNPPKHKELTMTRKVGNIEITFRKGDYVLNTKNDYRAVTLEEYERLAKLESTKELGFVDDEDLEEFEDTSLEPSYVTVYNGDTGIIRSIDEKKIVVEIDDELIVYDGGKIGNLLLSYAISTHKSQGSQAKYVINLSLPMHRRMLTRNLLYVADTRSSATMIEIGDLQTIKDAIKIADQNDRNTFLKGELQ